MKIHIGLRPFCKKVAGTGLRRLFCAIKCREEMNHYSKCLGQKKNEQSILRDLFIEAIFYSETLISTSICYVEWSSKNNEIY